MPRKLLRPEMVPTQVQERLKIWGNCIRQQRLRQGIIASELCARMDISDATLRRLEKGDPGAGAGTYMAALLILGLLDEAVPPLPPARWSGNAYGRVRPSKVSDGDVDDF